MYDVIIIGSGVMGMSVARKLSEAGLHIAVVDRDVPGMHASYKAGGMLGAQNEFLEDSALFQLATRSQKMFKTLSDQLKSEVGIDIQYIESGLIKLADEPNDNFAIEQQYQFLHQHNSEVELLNDARMHQLTGGNSYLGDRSAMYIPDDHQINANYYTKALFHSLKRRSIDRIFNTEVESIQSVDGGGYKVLTQDDVLTGQQVVVAGGAWSGQLLGSYIQEKCVTGVKGEVLLVEQPHLNLDTTLFTTSGCYIVPKQKDRYLIGATSYFDDYSVGVSEEGRNWLFERATKHVSGLKESKILKQWSGVRPYCTNEQPIMDEVAKDLFVITGHYRNGILLSPIIGELMSQWMLNHQRPQILESFQIERRQRNALHHQW